MVSKLRQAMIVAFVAGILLLIAGVSGFATWDTIRGFVSDYVVDNIVVQVVFAVLVFFASLGGISVILGGLLIGRERIGTGRFLISLGAGLGLIGLLVSIVVLVVEGSFTIGGFFSIGTIGLILAIVARLMVKK
jgi:hypothetical protein